MYNVCFYFVMFLVYSIFGWIMECIFCSIGEKRFIHDRGFLIGPYCPIYGCGAMYMYIFLNNYYNDPIVLFIMAIVGTSIIEYMTSYLMEKIFKARWWDYTNERFNVEGRICLRNSLFFGILGVAFVYFINPFYINIVEKIPSSVLTWIGSVLIVLFIIDNILSFSIMNKLKMTFTNIKKDSTSDIDKEVKGILTNYGFYLNRLFKAFPTVKVSLPSGEQIIDTVKNTLDSLDKYRIERKKTIKKIRKEIKEETTQHKKNKLKEELKKTKESNK